MDDRQPRFMRSAKDHIRLEAPKDVRYWTGLWGITDEELRQAITTVGTLASDVAAHLQKPLEDDADGGPFSPRR